MPTNQHEVQSVIEGIVVRVHDRGHLIDVADAHGTRPAIRNVRVCVGMMDPLTGRGESRLLQPGTRVVVTMTMGGPICIGVLPTPAPEVNDFGLEVTGLKDEQPNPTTGTPNFNASREKDTLPGDWILSNGEALLGLLLGGLAILKASPLAQIIMDHKDDLLRIVARQFQWFSDAGLLDIKSDDDTGKTSIRFRLGTDVSQSRSPEDAWDIAIDFGVSGDRPFVCRYRDRWSVEIDSENTLFVGGASVSIPGLDDLVASLRSITIAVARSVYIDTDNATLNVGSNTEIYSPTIAVTSTAIQCSASEAGVTMADRLDVAAGKGMDLETLLGDTKVSVSNAGNLKLSSGKFKGNVEITSTAGRVKVDTLFKPSSISLGGDVFAPVLDIPLTVLFTTMFTMLDLMTADLSAVQAIVTPLNPPASTKYLWTATLGAMLPALRSNIVRIGG